MVLAQASCAYAMPLRTALKQTEASVGKVQPILCKFNLFGFLFDKKEVEDSNGYSDYNDYVGDPDSVGSTGSNISKKSEAIEDLLKFVRYINAGCVGLLIFFITLKLIIKWGQLSVYASNPTKRKEVMQAMGLLIGCFTILSASSLIMQVLLSVFLSN